MNYDNETIRLLHERKSVRVFEKKDIPADIKHSILDAACQAATAGNQQLYTILEITKCRRKAPCFSNEDTRR